MPNKTKSGSTQKFTEIADISENVVLLKNGNGCLIIEVQATNFALLSRDEQDAKIYGYASFLNSLSFSIQLVIRNKKIDISSYVNNLTHQINNPQLLHPGLNEVQNGLLIAQIKLYRDFVQELVKVNTVLDKSFYIVVPYSPLEKGLANVQASVKKSSGSSQMESAKTVLHTKADGILNQLGRLGLRAKVLEKEDLARVLYDVYNPLGSNQISASTNTAIIGGTR